MGETRKENLKVLRTDRDELKADARDLLEEAIGLNFETVVIVGLKEGQVHFKKSRNASMVNLLGAIEVAKQELWDSWND